MDLTIKENEHQKWISNERFDHFLEIVFESLNQSGDIRLTAEFATKECKTIEELFAVGYIIGKGESYLYERERERNG